MDGRGWLRMAGDYVGGQGISEDSRGLWGTAGIGKDCGER